MQVLNLLCLMTIITWGHIFSLSVSTTLSYSQVWLQQYGYLPPGDVRAQAIRSPKAIASAVSAMQKFYGLTITGNMDPETVQWVLDLKQSIIEQATGGNNKFINKQWKKAISRNNHVSCTWAYPQSTVRRRQNVRSCFLERCSDHAVGFQINLALNRRATWGGNATSFRVRGGTKQRSLSGGTQWLATHSNNITFYVWFANHFNFRYNLYSY